MLQWVPYTSHAVASSETKPVAYVVSLGDKKLSTREAGKPVVLSAESAGEHAWFIVPDNSAGTGTTRYIIASAKKTFLAKAVDTDDIITSTERTDALSIEVLQDADRSGEYKLVSDGLVLTGSADGKVKLQPDSEDKALQWLFQLTPTEAAADKALQHWIIYD